MNRSLIAISVMFLISGCMQQEKDSKNKAVTESVKSDTTNTIQRTMTTITMKGSPIHTVGQLPAVGTQAENFTLTAIDLTEKNMEEFKGKNLILNIFPSVNTGVCAMSVRKFNEDAAGLKNTVVLCISKDLPFAQKAFCGAEGINNVVMLSDFRSDFGQKYGVLMVDGPLRGLLSRSVVVINPQGKIVYEEQVPEISHEPDYTKALQAVQ